MRRVVFVLLAATGCGHAAEDWVKVRRDDLVVGVEITGKVVAERSDTLGPPAISEVWDFKIAKMAPEGATVKKGEVVLGFDTTDLEQKLLQKRSARDAIAKELERAVANAQLAERDATLRVAEVEAKRRKATLKLDRPSDLTGSIELANAKLDLELSNAEVAFETKKAEETKKLNATSVLVLRDKLTRAEERIHEDEVSLKRMAIGAPRDGTVIYVSNWNDQKKKVGDTAWRQEKVLETSSLDAMIAKGDLDEVDASKAAVGQKVRLRLDAVPDVTFEGTVKAIGKTVQRQSRQNPLKVVRLDIALERSDLRMRPGMRFRGTAETARIANAVLVPTSAIFLTEKGPVSYRRTTSGFEMVTLVLGERNQDYAEVKSGIAEGDEVSRLDLSKAENRK